MKLNRAGIQANVMETAANKEEDEGQKGRRNGQKDKREEQLKVKIKHELLMV